MGGHIEVKSQLNKGVALVLMCHLRYRVCKAATTQTFSNISELLLLSKAANLKPSPKHAQHIKHQCQKLLIAWMKTL